MVAELRGGICILGRRFHLVGSFRAVFHIKGAWLWLRNSGAAFTS